MKTKILKIMLAFGCAATIAAVSSEALACHRSCHSSYCCKTYAYKCDGYQRYSGHYPFWKSGGIQGRPVKYVNGEYIYVQHCTKGYWKHHVWHRPCCS